MLPLHDSAYYLSLVQILLLHACNTNAVSETQISKPPKISPPLTGGEIITVNISGLPPAASQYRFQLRNNNNYEWRLTTNNNNRNNNKNYASARSRSSGVPDVSLENCDDIKSLQAPEAIFVASGWTKAVFRVRHSSKNVTGRRKSSQFTGSGDMALKMVDPKGTEMTRCVSRRGGDENGCREDLERKLMKEIVLMTTMRNENILKALGYCIPVSATGGIDRPITLLTELGEPVDLIKLVQMPWEMRLKIVYELTNLLRFLDSKSILISDFKIEQFVLVNGVLKLSDLDDLVFGDPSCSAAQEDCSRQLSPDTKNVTMSCKNEVCLGLNTLMNRHRASALFVKALMAGAPANFKPRVEDLMDWYTNPREDMSGLYLHMDDVLGAFKDGEYLESLPDYSSDFQKHDHQSITAPASDYLCPGSFSRQQCTLSAHHLGEAFAMCSERPHCDAFVWTGQTTWLGRRLFILKQLADSANFSLEPSNNTTVYVKRNGKV